MSGEQAFRSPEKKTGKKTAALLVAGLLSFESAVQPNTAFSVENEHENVERPISDQDWNEYCSLLAVYRESGVDIQMSPYVVNIDTAGDSSSLDFVQKMRLQINAQWPNQWSVHSSNPTHALMTRMNMLELPQELKPVSEQSIQLGRFMLRIHDETGDAFDIIDWLQNKVVDQIPNDRNNSDTTISSILTRLDSLSVETENQFQQFIVDLPSVEPRTPVIQWGEPLNEASRQNLESILEHYHNMTIRVQPLGRTPEEGTTQFSLTAHGMEAAGWRSMQVDGAIEQITFFKTQQRPDNVRPELFQPGSTEGRSFITQSEEFFDEEGYWSLTRTVHANEIDTAYRFVPYSIVSDDNQVPVSVDFSYAGGEMVNGLFTMSTLQEIPSSSEYSFVSRRDVENVAERLDAIWGYIDLGVEEVELFYGLEQKSLVDSVQIHHYDQANAEFDPSHPRAIVFRDPMLEEPPEEVLTTARHEAHHLAMQEFGIDRHPGMRKLFEEARSSGVLFDYINENNWFYNDPDLPFGHSGDNVFEFGATLLHTLHDPNIIEHIQGLPENVRQEYVNCILKVDQILRTVAQRKKVDGVRLPDNAPLFQTLQRVMESFSDGD